MEKETEIIDSKKSLGLFLKKTREAQGISIDDVSSKIGLSTTKIEAIEAGKLIENNAKQRIFIIKYLKFLNIYNEQSKQMLDEAYENDVDILTHTININHDLKDINFNAEIKKDKQNKVVKNKIKNTSIIVILLVICLVLISVFFISIKNNVNKTTVNETTLLSTTTLTPKQVIQTKPKIEIKKEKGIYKISGANTYNVEIKFKGASYLNITQIKTVADKTYNKDENITFEITKSEPITINTGKCENLEIFINETPLDFGKLIGVQSLQLDFEVNKN